MTLQTPRETAELDEGSESWSPGVMRRSVGIAGAVVLASLVYTLPPFDEAARKGLALLAFIGVLWLTEALDLAVTALLVPLGALVLGIPGLTTTSALAPFADPIVFLFLGGFALATALQVQKLDRKMAALLLSLSRGHFGWAVVLLFLATAVLSMGISNTATAAMMLPLSLGILGALDDASDRRTHAFVLLGVAYAASIGGIGTLVGSPPNAIAARAAGIDYAEWLLIGLPMVAVLLPLMFVTLWWVLRPTLNRRFVPDVVPVPWTPNMVLTLVVFGLTVLGWTFGTSPLKAAGIQSPDTFVAMAAAVALVALRLAAWKDVVQHTDWSVLLLFGGGLALGKVLDLSGASLAMGHATSNALQGTHPILVVLAVATFMVLLSEFASNTAAAALMVPIFGAMARQMGLSAELLVVVVGLAASFGFALPVATPPNAMVFGTGMVTQRRMLRAGMALDVVCILVLTAWGILKLG
jgi:sodium-dependent dicarboxylate transporter 2/3/5